MKKIPEKYINPFTDYGFKRLFGEEPNKDLLLDFLNQLLQDEEGEIKEISYLPNENLLISIGDRRAIFDLYCTNEKGEKFIVEIQKAEHPPAGGKDRTVYYSTFPIQEQAEKGKDWNFRLKHVYTIGILDFVFDEDKEYPNKFRYDVKLLDIDTKKVFYDKLTYIYLAMPKFRKTENELKTKFDKWLYVLKNLDRLEKIPSKLKEKIFLHLFEIAEISKLDKDEYRQYEQSLNAYRDIKNSIETAEEKGLKKGLKKGRKEGKEEGRREGEKEKAIKTAKMMLEDNESLSKIIKYTDLSKEDIENITKGNIK